MALFSSIAEQVLVLLVGKVWAFCFLAELTLKSMFDCLSKVGLGKVFPLKALVEGPSCGSGEVKTMILLPFKRGHIWTYSDAMMPGMRTQVFCHKEEFKKVLWKTILLSHWVSHLFRINCGLSCFVLIPSWTDDGQKGPHFDCVLSCTTNYATTVVYLGAWLGVGLLLKNAHSGNNLVISSFLHFSRISLENLFPLLIRSKMKFMKF